MAPVSCCSETSYSPFSRSINSCWAISVCLPSLSDFFAVYSLPSLVKFSQMTCATLSGSSGVIEGLIFLPLTMISMNLDLFLRLVSRGNQLLRYLVQGPQRWVTSFESQTVTRSISEGRMLRDVARGKQYLFITISSWQMVTCGSWYRIAVIFETFIQMVNIE